MNDKLFKKELKKLGARKMLLKYKNNLNQKQWDKLHIMINKELKQVKNDLFTHICIGMGIIILFGLIYKGNYAEQIQRCNDKKGSQCTAYDISKMYGRN